MLISIVTVVLNSEKTISDCLKSVICQKYKFIEHLLIDGGSSDQTLKIVDQVGTHLKKIISEPDNGLYFAMNKGARFASGDVLGFLNADDFYPNPYTLQHVAGVFSDPCIDVCFGDLQYVDRNNPELVRRYWKTGPYLPGRFSLGWAPPHPSFFVKRDIFAVENGFNTKYKLAADNDFMMRVLECRGYKSHYCPEVFVKMRVGGKTNKSFYNIILGNQEIFSALKCNGLKTNLFKYILNKVILRTVQHLYGLIKNWTISL